MAKLLIEETRSLDAHALLLAHSNQQERLGLAAGQEARIEMDWRDAAGRRRTCYFELDLLGCQYGGVRAYFTCPAEACQRRCAKLYEVAEHWLCRQCHGLAYATQRLHKFRRMMARSRKMLARIGGTDASGCVNPRPKGMHEKKYYRVWIEADHLQDRAFGYVMSQHPEWGKLV